MSDWANLPSCVLGLVLGCLDLLCGCGGGDGNVRLVCREWGMCRVICSCLKLCHGCSEEGVERVLSGVEIRGVRRVCVDFKGRRMTDRLMGGLMTMELLEELSFRKEHVLMDKYIGVLGRCVNLRILRLGNCELVNCEKLCVLSKLLLLEELAVHKCGNLTRELLLRFGFLQKLSVSRCKLGENGKDFCRGFEGMKMLRDLNMSECMGIDDDCVGMIGDFVEGLERLNLSGCNVTNRGVGIIGDKLKGLRYLNLDKLYPHINDTGIMQLEGLVGLEELSLSTANLTNRSLKMFNDRFKKLRCLSMSDCHQVSDEGVRIISELKELEELNLENTSVCGAGFECGFVKLRELNLMRCKKMDYVEMMEGIIGGSDCNRNCNYGIRVDVCVNVNENENVPMIMNGLKNVRRLFLSTKKCNDNVLEKMAKLGDLEKLDLSLCGFVTDKSLKILGTITSLRELNLSSCLSNCSDEGFKYLTKLILLKKIWLSCNEIMRMNVMKELNKMKNLCEIYIK